MANAMFAFAPTPLRHSSFTGRVAATAPLCAPRPQRSVAPKPSSPSSPTPPTLPNGRIPVSMRRSGRGSHRSQPVEEAFATCPSCGSDEPVAALNLLRYGSTKARCGQCGHAWTATVADALTDSGTGLLDANEERQRKNEQRRQQEQQQVGQQQDQHQQQQQQHQQQHQVLRGKHEGGANARVRLFVAGLGGKVDSKRLRSVMENYGEVRDANVVFDRETGRSRGVGFVTVVGRSAAEAAIDDLTGSTTLGRRLAVREAIPY